MKQDYKNPDRDQIQLLDFVHILIRCCLFFLLLADVSHAYFSTNMEAEDVVLLEERTGRNEAAYSISFSLYDNDLYHYDEHPFEPVIYPFSIHYIPADKITLNFHREDIRPKPIHNLERSFKDQLHANLKIKKLLEDYEKFLNQSLEDLESAVFPQYRPRRYSMNAYGPHPVITGRGLPNSIGRVVRGNFQERGSGFSGRGASPSPRQEFRAAQYPWERTDSHPAPAPSGDSGNDEIVGDADADSDLEDQTTVKEVMANPLKQKELLRIKKKSFSEKVINKMWQGVWNVLSYLFQHKIEAIIYFILLYFIGLIISVVLRG